MTLDLREQANWLNERDVPDAEVSKAGPPRPGLVPQSGDSEHPVRWVRPAGKKPQSQGYMVGEAYLDHDIHGDMLSVLLNALRGEVEGVISAELPPQDVEALEILANDYSQMAAAHRTFAEIQRWESTPQGQKRLEVMRGLTLRLFGDEPRTLYRGLAEVSHFMELPESGVDVEAPIDNLSSWTTDPAVAKEFALDGFIMEREVTPDEVLLAPVLFSDAHSLKMWGYQKEFVLRNEAGSVKARVTELVE